MLRWREVTHSSSFLGSVAREGALFGRKLMSVAWSSHPRVARWWLLIFTSELFLSVFYPCLYYIIYGCISFCITSVLVSTGHMVQLITLFNSWLYCRAVSIIYSSKVWKIWHFFHIKILDEGQKLYKSYLTSFNHDYWSYQVCHVLFQSHTAHAT